MGKTTRYSMLRAEIGSDRPQHIVVPGKKDTVLQKQKTTGAGERRGVRGSGGVRADTGGSVYPYIDGHGYTVMRLYGYAVMQ